MIYHLGGGQTFKFPDERKLRIKGCTTKEDLRLAQPAEFDNDSEGQHAFIVGKDGSTTGLTFGRYTGLVSYTLDDGIESVQLSIYNSTAGKRGVELFAAKGDSGSLVWHITANGKAHIVGQLHSG